MLSKLRYLSQRPGARIASHNFLWLAAEKSVRLILGFGVGLWVARYLGPTEFGVFGYCAALVVIIGILPSLGLDAEVKRELLQRPESTIEVMASLVVARLIASVLTYLALLLAVFVGWGVRGDERQLLAILGLSLFQPVLLAPDLWLQANLRAGWSVSVQLCALVACSGMRVWLVVTNGSLIDFGIIVVLEVVLASAGVWLVARHLGFGLSLSKVRIATMKRLLSNSWPLMFASFAVVAYMKIDEVMLRHYMGPAAVGIYTAAARLSEIWYFLPVLFASSVLPAFLRARAQDPIVYRRRMQQYMDLSAATAYLLTVPIALAAPWLVRTAYGAAFSGAGPILAVHIWSSVFVFIGVARGQWLVNERMQRFYLLTTIGGAVANILLNILAIPRWGGLGAAYATVASYAISAWVASYLHPAARPIAVMQTRALLIPVVGWRYLRRR